MRTCGDGTSDDSGAIQAALDKAAATTSGNGGLVFVPSGRYRLTRTLYVWRGVRVIGCGATRPVFVLADNTPGYQKGIGLMVMFTHAARPGAPPTAGSSRVPFPPPGTVPNCSETGVLGAAAGVMGSLQGLEVLKEAAGLGTGLAGKILTYKALSTDFRMARLPKDPSCALCGTAPTITDLSGHG